MLVNRKIMVISICVFCDLLLAYICPAEFIYDSHNKKDPFNPPILKTQAESGTNLLSSLKVEGIIWDENKPVAIISDKVVSVGDVISGAKVVNIKQNEVVFDINGELVYVKLQIKTE